tara:strand:+ start:8813 stop:9322 length:510 start_codon:yes stop_codon:yes gene_type:complete
MDFSIDYNGSTKTPEKVYLNIGYNNFKQQSTYDLFSQIVLPINKEVFLVSENLWMCLRTHDKSQFDMINEVFNKMYEKNSLIHTYKINNEFYIFVIANAAINNIYNSIINNDIIDFPEEFYISISGKYGNTISASDKCKIGEESVYCKIPNEILINNNQTAMITHKEGI